MVRAFTCLLTARSVRRFVRPFGTAGVRAAKISLSAVNQCCSASPWGEPLATHIWYARSRIRSDKCWSMLCSTSLISLILLSAPSSLPVRYLILPGRATASTGAATGTCARTTRGQRLTSLLAGFCLPAPIQRIAAPSGFDIPQCLLCIRSPCASQYPCEPVRREASL